MSERLTSRLKFMGDGLTPYLTKQASIDRELKAKNGVTLKKLHLDTILCLELGECKSEFFPSDEPACYQLHFVPGKNGLKFIEVVRLIDQKNGVWQECDLDTSYLILEALNEILPNCGWCGR